MKRRIITIDEKKCTGCGRCLPNCPEGAIHIIDGKARLVGDLFCDGLGACLKHCPEGAISFSEREAEPYDEEKVMVNIVKAGANVIRAHLEHLRAHNQQKYLAEALAFLRRKGIEDPLRQTGDPAGSKPSHAHPCCPGAFSRQVTATEEIEEDEDGRRPGRLAHWPIQLHLISPGAPQYNGCDLLLAADCVACTVGDFHQDWLKGRSLAIACPKLDNGQEVYVEKIRALIDEAKINTLTVMTMQVPCCSGLLALAQEAAAGATRKMPIKNVVVSLRGDILKEEWVAA